MKQLGAQQLSSKDRVGVVPWRVCFFSPPRSCYDLDCRVALFMQGPQYVLAEIPTSEYSQVADL